jgi:hypothetical protein
MGGNVNKYEGIAEAAKGQAVSKEDIKVDCVQVFLSFHNRLAT